jgi:hypothetical protein
VLTRISGSENSSIINIKSTIQMHTALIFKEQEKVKESRLYSLVRNNEIYVYLSDMLSHFRFGTIT